MFITASFDWGHAVYYLFILQVTATQVSCYVAEQICLKFDISAAKLPLQRWLCRSAAVELCETSLTTSFSFKRLSGVSFSDAVKTNELIRTETPSCCLIQAAYGLLSVAAHGRTPSTSSAPPSHVVLWTICTLKLLL